jgi:hypothetical protein
VANRDPEVRSNPFTRPCPLQGMKSQLSTIVVGSNSNNIIKIIIIISIDNYKKNIFWGIRTRLKISAENDERNQKPFNI